MEKTLRKTQRVTRFHNPLPENVLAHFRGGLLERPPPEGLPVVEGQPPASPGPRPLPAPGRSVSASEDGPCPMIGWIGCQRRFARVRSCERARQKMKWQVLQRAMDRTSCSQMLDVRMTDFRVGWRDYVCVLVGSWTCNVLSTNLAAAPTNSE